MNDSIESHSSVDRLSQSHHSIEVSSDNRLLSSAFRFTTWSHRFKPIDYNNKLKPYKSCPRLNIQSSKNRPNSTIKSPLLSASGAVKHDPASSLSPLVIGRSNRKAQNVSETELSRHRQSIRTVTTRSSLFSLYSYVWTNAEPITRYRRTTAMELLAIVLLLTLTVVISCTAGRSRHISPDAPKNLPENLPASNVLPLVSSFEPEVIDVSTLNQNVPSFVTPFGSSSSSSVLSSSTSSSQSHSRRLLKSPSSSSLSHHRYPSPYLQRVMLRNNSATCNDGTSAGYYIRHGRRGSKHWIVFLEGGWFCYSSYTCHLRWIQMRNLMSSAHWSEYRAVGGILSADQTENPFYFDAHHVFLPYCSSDNWSGDAAAKSNREFSFQGARIVRNVINDLLNRGLANADVLILSGSSAGAGGVLINLDRVANHLRSIGSKVQVRGIADSGWFLDNQPFLQQAENPLYAKYLTAACREGHVCAPIDSVRQGYKLWNGQVPDACLIQYKSEPWKCYFGYRMYTTLRAPLFIVQWLFDEAQMAANNVANPMNRAQWDYIYKMGLQIRNSLHNVTGVFAPSCVSHIILTSKNWNEIKINEISLPQALICWEAQLNRHLEPASSASNLNSFRRLGKRTWSMSSGLFHDNRIVQYPSGSFTSSTGVVKKSTRKRKKKNRKVNSNRFPLSTSDYLIDPHSKSTFSFTSTRARSRRFSTSLDFRSQCVSRLVDSCTWPQCNSLCPPLLNPLTGEEMHLSDLLRSFGFNMASFASSFGIDPQTFNSMDRRLLLQLLSNN